jgi:hypothetical protein
MNIRIEQPLQAWPIAVLNGGEHVADRWNLIRHGGFQLLVSGSRASYGMALTLKPTAILSNVCGLVIGQQRAAKPKIKRSRPGA